MNVNDAISAYNGVISWVNSNKYDFGKPKKKSHRAIDQHLNAVFRQFGKEHNIQMEKNNSPGYKGSYNPMMSNCIEIQKHWSEFKLWVKKTYPKIS
jgi:hypothetical protein